MNIPQPLENKFSCDVIRNKFIDIIILVAVPLGIVATFFETYREYSFGIGYWIELAIFNLIAILIALLIYFFRSKFSLDLKIAAISAGFFLAGVRGLIEFGSLSNTYVFFTISLIILQLRVNRTWMLILVLLTLLVIITIGFSTHYSPLIDEN